MNQTVAYKLNYLPHKTSDVSFQNWVRAYKYHIDNIFNIFCFHIKDIEPFNNRDLDNKEVFERFAQMLYKKSSRII